MDPNYYYTVNGLIVHNLSEVPENSILQKHPRLCGGKGGFGSMLRAIGSQIEKTTNREMCRDLNGRRMRDINNEKRLKEWLDKSDAREREKIETYLEKRRKRKLLLEQGPSVNIPFEDKTRDDQRKQIAEELQDAINEAFEKRKDNESKVVEIVKPKKYNLNVDSDLESSSSSCPSSPVANNDANDLCANENDNVANDLCIDEDDNVANDLYVNEGDNVANGDSDADGLCGNKDDNVASTSSAGSIVEEIPADHAQSVGEPPLKRQKCDDDETVTEVTPVVPKEVTYLPIDLNQVGSVNHLLTFGTDWIKNELTSRGLKCGGTLMERAQRLFSVKGLAEYPQYLLAGYIKKKRN